MIGQFRFLGLVIELLWMNGFLVGFSLPQASCKAVGINLGPFCLCLYFDEPRTCAICGRPLHWGLHGKLWRFSLCRPNGALAVSA